MIIDRDIQKFIVFSEDTLGSALRRISANRSRIVFCLSASGVLEGVLTDGDVRRWMTSSGSVDIDIPAIEVANKEFVSLSKDASPEELEHTFSDRVSAVPLIDGHRHLVAIARPGEPELRIGQHVLRADTPAFIIAEIGNNHNGSVEIARRLVDEAVRVGADCAKFQMRSMRALYRGNGEGGNLAEDLGAQYTLDLLSRFQLPNEELFKVFDYAKEQGVLPLCTPWDLDSLEALERYGVEAYKLASADLTNHDLLVAMARTGKVVICSTGMSNEAEIVEAVKILSANRGRFILLHCNSTYPAPFKDLHLHYLDRLREISGAPVGYSGHERGISVALAAVARGAKVIEKHFTLDRNMEGNDHRVSLLPDEFRQMVQGIREIEQALGSKKARRVTQGEMMNREVLGKSLVARRAVRAGEIIIEDMLEVRSPGRGLAPNRKRELLGLSARRDIPAGEFFYPADVEKPAATARAYSFRRPFGIPVRYHDLRDMAKRSNFDLLEFHMSYRDMEEPPEKHMGDAMLDLDLVVHSPELFSGDHVMDLCADDNAYRRRSIAELQRVVDVTRRLRPHFKRAVRPLIIINAGGFTLDGPLPVSARGVLYNRIRSSLAEVDSEGVEIIPQTMPPFPWHFGGQRFHNLFMDSKEIVDFCRNAGTRVCLDISHSQLACTHLGASFREFLQEVGPYSAHLHIVDAEGTDGEGLQIGEGSIDFGLVAGALDAVAPQASFIPEIWQGHKNGGAGFWEALEKLEKWF